jgi:hypothetical protein
MKERMEVERKKNGKERNQKVEVRKGDEVSEKKRGGKK